MAEKTCADAFSRFNPVLEPELYIEAGFKLIDSYIANHKYTLAIETIERMQSHDTFSSSKIIEYRLIRKRGSILFHEEKFADAILEFEQALQLALSSQDELNIGKSYNDLGVMYRSQGVFQTSLSHLLNSLHYKKRSGDHHAIATTINNIGNVYRDMNEHQNALEQYNDAIELFEMALNASDDQRSLLNIAHTKENIGLSYSSLQQHDIAIDHLKLSLASFENFERPQDQLRLNLSIARVLIDNQQLKSAHDYLIRAETISNIENLNAPLNYYELMCQLLDLQRHYPRMLGIATEGYELSKQLFNIPKQSLFAELQAKAYAKLGEHHLAYEKSLIHQTLKTQVEQARYNKELAKNRTIYDLERREEKILSLNKDIQINTLEQRQTTLIFSTCIIILSSVIIGLWLFRIRQQRQFRKKINLHRQRETELSSSHQRLTTILDSSDDRVIVLDQSNHIVFINQSFVDFSNFCSQQILGRSVTTIFPDLLQAKAFQNLSEDAPEATISALSMTNNRAGKPATEPVYAEFLFQSDGTVLVSLRTTHPTASDLTAISVLNTLKHLNLLKDQFSSVLASLTHPGVELSSNDQTLWHQLTSASESLNQVLENSNVQGADFQYQSSLVNLMQSAIKAWHTSTGMGKLELAEKSGIWRITIDEGRLRTRSLDRYLSVQKLPKHPRWREVVRTIHYVLANCTLPTTDQTQLSDLLKHFELLQQARL